MTYDPQKHAKVLIRYSIDAKPGWLVVIEGPVLALPLLRACHEECLAVGANPVLRITDDACNDTIMASGAYHQVSFLDPSLMTLVKSANAWITAEAWDNTKSLTRIDAERSIWASLAMKKFNEVWDFRTCSYDHPRFMPRVLTAFPCHAAAQDAEMSLRQYEELLTRAAFLDCDNPVERWQAFAAQQEELIGQLSQFSKFRMVTAQGTDVTFSVPHPTRKWWPCAGKENFPDGEVYTTPMEDDTNGQIYFNTPSVYDGVEVDGVYIRFKDGHLENLSVAKNRDYLQQMLSMDAGASRIGELAFGLNSQVTAYGRNILFDEKIGGTFHIALGSAYSNTGGTNKSELHWDMVCDLRQDGEVYGDGKLIQKNGVWLFH